MVRNSGEIRLESDWFLINSYYCSLYKINQKDVFHFDLYRLNDPYELELMGIRDYLDVDGALFLFEWPSKGGDEIPKANLVINIQRSDEDDLRHVTIDIDSLELFEALTTYYAD